jgi:hypothetical protein
LFKTLVLKRSISGPSGPGRIHYWWYGTSRYFPFPNYENAEKIRSASETVPNVVVVIRNLVAEAMYCRDSSQRNQGRDQGVLNQILA